MNNIIVENHKIYKQGGIIFLPLQEDTCLTFQEKDIEVYIIVQSDIKLTLSCSTKVTLHVFNQNHIVDMAIHLKENGQLQGYISLLATKPIKQTIYINHEQAKTKSEVFCHGISCQDGQIDLIVNGSVPRGKIECICNQTNQIINLNQGKSTIQPNLWIDEYDVVANHAAYIGDYAKDSVFYLQTKGLTIPMIYQILSKAFLLQTSQYELYNELMNRSLETVLPREVIE